APRPRGRPTAAGAEGEPERAGRHGLDVERLGVLAKPHDRSLAEIALDLRERGIKSLRLVHGRTFDETQCGAGHCPTPYDRDSEERQREPIPRRRSPSRLRTVHDLFCVRNMFFPDPGLKFTVA